MKKIIQEIVVLNKDDKLIILCDKVKPFEIDRSRKIVDKFLKDKGGNSLFVSGVDVYIIRKGAKVLLKDYLNKEIHESKKGSPK